MSLFKKLASCPTKSSPSDQLLGLPLDLTYITPQIIVCSFPTSRFPYTLYRNNFNDLSHFLDIKHEDHWQIWNLRAESLNDYLPESLDQLNYYPWPDHESPPYAFLCEIIDSIHRFITESKVNVAVIHCKMGKGRSGLVTVSYLIKHELMEKSKAENLFTTKRMRHGFGPGVSILSQRRYIKYVELNKVFDYDPLIRYKVDFVKVICPYFENFEDLEVAIHFYHDQEETNQLVLAKKKILTDHEFIRSTPHPICILRTSDLDQNVWKQDFRISFELKDNKTQFPVSTAYLWFNVYWESFTSSTNRCHFKWDDFDGFKGTSKKGLKLFDKVEIFYTSTTLKTSSS